MHKAGASLIERLLELDFRPIDSIVSHLRYMLNTKQGHALVAANYGMPDITEFSQSPDPMENVRRSLQRSIEAYEPRLTNVRVEPILAHDELDRDKQLQRIRFHVTARLKGDALTPSVSFETEVERSGQIAITT